MRDPLTALLYGPQGPETIRIGDDHWGKYLEETVAGEDTENYIEKTQIIGKHMGVAATVLAIIDVGIFNNTGGWVNTLQRFKYHYTPWLGCSVAYTSTVVVASALRGGKTDQWNHFIAGFGAGAFLGKFNKSFITGMVTGLGFAMLGFYYKDSKMRDYEMVPSIWKLHRTHGHPFTHKTDYTTNWPFKPRPGYWARTEADVEKVYKQGQLGDGNTDRRYW